MSAVTQAARDAFGNTSPQLPPADNWAMQNPEAYTLIWVGADPGAVHPAVDPSVPARGQSLSLPRFEELDWRETPMGEISLRRRRDPALDVDVYEVKLGDEFLMSSLFTVAEVELSRLGLAACRTGRSTSSSAGSGWATRRGRRSRTHASGR